MQLLKSDCVDVRLQEQLVQLLVDNAQCLLFACGAGWVQVVVGNESIPHNKVLS